MPRSFRFELPAGATRDPRFIARAVLGVLLLLNLIAAYAVFQPLGGSAEQLEAELSTLRSQVQARQANLRRTRTLVSKIEQARKSGDDFLGVYFLDERTMSSNIVAELSNAAKTSGMRQREQSFSTDPVEGSADLSMMTVTATLEGSYGDLLEFVNSLDRSGRFLILDTLTAAPQQGGPNLLVTIKMNTFVRQVAS